MKKHLISTPQKRFNRKSNIAELIHGENGSFSCDDCLKIFKTKKNFLQHRKRHLGEYVTSCDICNRGFVTRNEYNQHMKYKHGNNICPVCGRSCYNLRKHLKIHSDGYQTKRLACGFCDKTFAQQHLLDYHYVRMHKDGGRRYICDICGKEIRSFEGFKGHMNMHKESNPIQCVQCGKKFGLVHSLNLHMRLHTGEKPHCCAECGKSFSQRGSLSQHMKTHLGNKSLACAFCDGMFVNKIQLNYHIKNQHKKI